LSGFEKADPISDCDVDIRCDILVDGRYLSRGLSGSLDA
jgi:hypothetical protein